MVSERGLKLSIPSCKAVLHHQLRSEMGERASSATQTAHNIESAEGTMSDLMSSLWDEMPVAVLHSVAALLDENSIEEVRLVCKAWKQPATFAIKTLRPRMTGSLGLQWHNLRQLSKVFPKCRVLDLRSYKVPSDSAQHLSYTFLTKVLLSNVEADPDPSRSLAELQRYMTSAGSYNPVLSFVVDIHRLPTFLKRAPFTDAECLMMMQYPAPAQVVTLHLGYMPVAVTQTGLGYIAQLTTLVELSVTCCEDIDDTHMRLLSALTNLERLRVGPLKGCTSEGLTSGLSTLTRLQKLYLIDAIHIKDETIAHISCSLSATLRALSLANCPQLTDESMPYLCMPHLSTLFFSNNSFVTLQGVQQLASQSSSLFDLDFRGCTCLSVKDRMKLQQVLRSQHTANLCSTLSIAV